MKSLDKTKEELQNISNSFNVYGDFVEVSSLGEGNINDTFLLKTCSNGKKNQYVLQRINREVFCNPVHLMNNISIVTKHLIKVYQWETSNKKNGKTCIELVYTKADAALFARPYYIDENGEYWRCYIYIAGGQSFRKVIDTSHARALAIAFAQFQKDLMQLDREQFHTTIENFHNLCFRYEEFAKAVSEDACKRNAMVSAEISFYRERESAYSILEQMRSSNDLVSRLCHNDTKVENVLMDISSGEVIAVIDLDTVMLGTILYDFGDLCRTSLSNSREDETNIDCIDVRLDYFQALVDGFLSEWGMELSALELELLVVAPKIMSLTIGLRFLTDYLSGDRYFKTNCDAHNLIRTRASMALILSLEKKEPEMRKIVHKKIQKYCVRSTNIV